MCDDRDEGLATKFKKLALQISDKQNVNCECRSEVNMTRVKESSGLPTVHTDNNKQQQNTVE